MTPHSVGQGTANEKQLTAQEAALTRSEDPSVDPRRLLGAYYTPDPLPGILTEWALTPGRGTVLDPSYGGCAFLNAATKVLTGKGVLEPGRLVFGVDVDRSCLEYVRGSGNLAEKNCIVRDFLTLSPKDLHGAPFQAVVGNPPYVRHHWFNGTTREAARAAIDDAGVALPARASAWAYFLVHALSFVAKHGRLAMLVPEAIQQVDYAASVREALVARFERVCLVHIRDRLFDHTDEAVVAIRRYLVSGSKDKTAKIWETETGKCVNTLLFDSSVAMAKFVSNIDMDTSNILIVDDKARVFEYEVVIP